MEHKNTLDFKEHKTGYSISDLAEALRALQRVCGFNYNHNDIFLACLAAAHEHGGQEFRASFAELGARMSGEVEPYKKNMSEGERKNRRRALEQRFKRAFKKLEADQKATGLWFVTVRRGGFIDGERVKSSITVDLDSVNRTIEIARKLEDFAEHRIRCFERAAEKVRDGKTRNYLPADKTATVLKQNDEREQLIALKRYESNIKTYTRKLYEYAAAQDNFSEETANALKEHLQRKIARWFAVDFPTLLEADKQAAVRASARPERMDDITRQIKATGGKVHTSDHHTLVTRDTDACTVGVSAQEEIPSPHVILNNSSGEALMSDKVQDENPLADALKALDLVRSIGAWRSNVILVDDATKHSEVLAKDATLEEVKKRFPAWLESSEREQKSLVVDLKPNGRRIIQVDEASAEVMQMLTPVSFMTVETSDGNGQVWLALPEGLSDTEIADVKDRLFLLLKAKGANKGASGGLRWVGTHNFKPERKRPDGSFPRVKLLDSKDGRTVTTYELQALGLLAEPKPKVKPRPASIRPRATRAPSYDYAMRSVRRKANGDVDRSGVDVLFACTCLDWGLTETQTVALLNEHSSKAQERRDDYAEKVVAWAEQNCRCS